MSFLLRRLGLLLALSLSISQAACAGSASEASSTGQPPPDPGEKAEVRFDDTSTLELGLGVPASLHVTVSPPKAHSVAFTLVGASLDASLDASVVAPDGDGHAAVTLRAPSQATTFRVRATLLDASGAPGASAERAVAVSNEGFGTVKVSPHYLGQRAITTWTASVVAKSTCKDLAATLPHDPPGALMGTAPVEHDPVIDHVPVGADLAVTLRAGHFAWGCAAVPSLIANATVDVTVPVIDKPLDLASASFASTFTYSVDPISYASFLADAVSALDDAFMPTGTPEGTIVLNAMSASSTDPATFQQVRTDMGWDAIAQQHFDGLGQGLRDTCAAWATAGVALQPTAFQASIVAGKQPGQALVAVTQLGALDPAAAGAVGAMNCTWSAQPGDTVLLSGALYFEPSRFAGAASLASALEAEPAVSTVSEALALVADCQGLAVALGPFGSCDIACVQDLCAQAITVRWQAALDASNQAAVPGQISFEASANATIDDYANPTSLSGQWIGQVGDTTVMAQAMGGLTATQSAPVPFNPQ